MLQQIKKRKQFSGNCSMQWIIDFLIVYLVRRVLLMKKILIKIGSVFTSVVLLVGTLSANVACVGPFYQPKVPEKMKRY